jgi:hypothetical protein
VKRPEKSAIILAIDETRKRDAHGFERKFRWERTRTFIILPIIPNTKMNIEK